MIIAGLSKRPEETQQLTIHYDRWLGEARIAGYSVTPVVPITDTLAYTTVTENDDTDIVVYFTGGTAGRDYTLLFDLVMSDGQRRCDTVQLQVRSMD